MPKIKFITLEQLMEMDVNGQKFKLVYVLHPSAFKKGHIPGSINIPFDELKTTKILKKTDTIIVYCSSYSCHASTNAAALLIKRGYKKVLDFKAGAKGWADADLGLQK
jgi:rhodanese-related sulfurtransferase